MPDSVGDPLDALRDIHLPPEPGFWPPAPGWWALAALLLLLGAAFAVWWRRAARRRRPDREALRRLAALRAALEAGETPPHRVAAASASLLRRAALGRFPRRQVAGLTGRAWLEFLAAHGGGPEFSGPDAAHLVTAPYAPDTGPNEAERVIALCERWVRARALSRRPARRKEARSAAGTPC